MSKLPAVLVLSSPSLLLLAQSGWDHHPRANPGGPGRLKAKQREILNTHPCATCSQTWVSCAVVPVGWTQARADAVPFR